MIQLVLAALIAQEPPAAEVARLKTVHERVTRLSHESGELIWPGFRPDTIPVLYVLPGQGVLLLGWSGPAPEGFTPVAGGAWQPGAARGAASTGTELAGRPAAQVVVGTQTASELVGLTVHEAFHVFRRLAQRENSFLVSSYPVFDARNEAGMALEGRILAAAQRARDRTAKRALVRQFLAVRESRHRMLGGDLAAFEQLAELNEGLAEYALLRAGEITNEHPTFGDRLAGLEGLTADRTRSIRLRYYATGSAQAHLLDLLAGPSFSWKARLVAENLTLQDLLAEVSEYRRAEDDLRRHAEGAFAMRAIEAAADSGVGKLRVFRRAQVDSLLGAPGVLLVMTLEGRSLGLCGIDPQNLLQVDQGVLLHTRWVQPCAGDALQATFNTPVVQDRNTGSLRAVVGADSTVRLTVGGQATELRDGSSLENATAVRLESPLFTLHAAKADIAREGRVVTVRVKT
ncbi:MAG TPA: hypothetical protein VK573_00285 [Gemmatimonadales bacterium]|nr:hypothetical protein [Gemmatimonadales bacterium]